MIRRGPTVERPAETREGGRRVQLGHFSLERDPTGTGWNFGRKNEVLLAGLTDEQASALVALFLERHQESEA